jgi:hypothetical protein
VAGEVGVATGNLVWSDRVEWSGGQEFYRFSTVIWNMAASWGLGATKKPATWLACGWLGNLNQLGARAAKSAMVLKRVNQSLVEVFLSSQARP